MKPKILSINLLITALIILLGGSMAGAQTVTYAQKLADCKSSNQIFSSDKGCMVNIAAPEFAGITLDGKKINPADLKGKVIVLNFWFIACSPCHLEVPALNEVARRYKDNKDVVFISVARDEAPALNKYLADRPLGFQNISDKQGAIAKDVFNITGYPTTIIINKDGLIKFFKTGGRVNEKDAYDEITATLPATINAALSK